MSKYVLFCEGDVTKRTENVEIKGKIVRSGLTVLRRRYAQKAMKLAKQRYSQCFSGANSYFPPKFGNWFPLQFATRSFRGFLQKTGFSEKKTIRSRFFSRGITMFPAKKRTGENGFSQKSTFCSFQVLRRGYW